MNLFRGNLLPEIWTDTNWMTPPERKQLATFVSLVKAQPGCFDNCRFVLGNPWKGEPYGYSATDGKRGFFAVHNACLKDSVVTLKFDPASGFPDSGRWDVYRWYPNPARLRAGQGATGRELTIVMRPYEVTMLEVVPEGVPASLNQTFEDASVPLQFAEPTRDLKLLAVEKAAKESSCVWKPLAPKTAVSAAAVKLTVREDQSIVAGGEVISPDTYIITTRTELKRITGILLETLSDDSLPGKGPGRAVNGNFALTGFRVKATQSDGAGDPVELKFKSAKADYSQASHGNWPINAALDADPKTGWSIDPMEGQSHAGVFEFEKPVGFEKGTTLSFELSMGDRDHSIGRLRLSATDSAKPDLPPTYAEVAAQSAVRVEIPRTKSGGILLLVGGRQDAKLGETKLNGETVKPAVVWAGGNWPCPWRAWRLEIPVGPDANLVVVKLDPSQWSVYFIPSGR